MEVRTARPHNFYTDKINKLKNTYQELKAEVEKDGSPSEKETLERISALLDQVDEKLLDEANKKQSSGGQGSEATSAGEPISNPAEMEWHSLEAVLNALKEIVDRLTLSGHKAASALFSRYSEILEARTEERWQDAVDLLQSTIDLARQAEAQEDDNSGQGAQSDSSDEEGTEGSNASETTDPFVPPNEAGEPTLRPGDTDIDGWVEYLQALLNFQLGKGTVTVNGTFDPKTKQAVSQFQAQKGCSVDGIVGNQTWSALREDKELDAVGTDGREPGSHSEEGPEGRWGLESDSACRYDEQKKYLRLTVVSVGTEPIDAFKADVFINGKREKITIGPVAETKKGVPLHWVKVPDFRERHGLGPYEIDAYLPQELGGDRWSMVYGASEESNGEDNTEESPSGGGDDQNGADTETTDTSQTTDPFVPPTESSQPTLRPGDTDEDGWVEYLQAMLNHHLGRGTLPVTGKFDSKTKQAVLEFQAQRGCSVDGIVGNQTWSAVREDREFDEIGTDGREPGSHSEQGPEGRWGTESSDILHYDIETDLMQLSAVSVGTEPIDDFKADVFINGSREQIRIGKPFSTDRGIPLHRVKILKVQKNHGPGPYDIEAYLPQELGGDRWSKKAFDPNRPKGPPENPGKRGSNPQQPGGGGNNPSSPSTDPKGGSDTDGDFKWQIDVFVLDAENNKPYGADVSVWLDGPTKQTASLNPSAGRVHFEVIGTGRYSVQALVNDGRKSQIEVIDEPEAREGHVQHTVELFLSKID